MRERPILFNTEMVRAILDGRKTQTRRVIKPASLGLLYEDGSPSMNPPVEPGDVLWVRETWKQYTAGTAGPGLIDGYLYKADEPQDTTGMMVEDRWHPSIHMPRRAARLFLRVKEVRAQRLHEIMNAAPGPDNPVVKEGCTYGFEFIAVWNSTIKPADLPRYGWDANPWVWVIEFEREWRSNPWT